MQAGLRAKLLRFLFIRNKRTLLITNKDQVHLTVSNRWISNKTKDKTESKNNRTKDYNPQLHPNYDKYQK